MGLKNYILIAVLVLGMTGCTSEKDKAKNLENGNSTTKVEKSNDKNAEKENKNIQELKDKFKESSYSSESNPKELSMDESIDYAKKVIPENVKEISNKFEKEVGVTQKIYEYEDYEIEVRYMHPYKEDGNQVDEYDLSKTVGIYFNLLNN
ncbi:hypothetical protein [Faecalimicrobium sp. JNUCC 81]